MCISQKIVPCSLFQRPYDMETDHNFELFDAIQFSDEESLLRSQNYRSYMQRRRSIRYFDDRPVDKRIVEHIVMTASSAPSGAHKQPWSFALVSSPTVKKEIREAAEKEEYLNYNGRMSEEWKADLEKFATNWKKEFLEVAPWLIVVFKQTYEIGSEGERLKNYYVNESVGIASGMLISAIHHAGLVTLTHTPSPMNFLEKILHRPPNEKAYLLLPVGYPADDAQVPVLKRKTQEEVLTFY